MAVIIDAVIYARLGKTIKELRDKLNKSQEEFAKDIEVSRASLANYESGSQPVSVSTLYKIAIVLNKEIYDLLPSVEEISRSLPDKKLQTDSSLGNKEKAEVREFMEKAQGGDKNEGNR